MKMTMIRILVSHNTFDWHLKTNARTVVEFIKNGWCLPRPNLIISVTGGGKHCHMSAHLRKIFQRGVVTAAATTSKTRVLYNYTQKQNTQPFSIVI